MIGGQLFFRVDFNAENEIIKIAIIIFYISMEKVNVWYN